MRRATHKNLTELQRNPSNIRNICILAHVDHGKTTLADTLVASNGIISQKMAGKLRYLDSREDEQIRGITMKSSAISLHYANGNNEYLLNLIDSPGHIDFSSEVSTAVRLCDGAIVLVDVVEGVCPQTHAVLRQAWLENIKPVLVLNKIDRLILELKMSPMEAYVHLSHLLQQVNAITGELFTSEVLQKTAADAENKKNEAKTNKSLENEDVIEGNSSAGLEDIDDSNLYFSPDQGNVIFASAIDGWGFGVDHFADILSKKLNFNVEALKKTLWGDFYIESKTKRIKKGAQYKSKKPLFVQFVLENIWAVYDTICVKKDKGKLEKIVATLGMKINPRDLKHNETKVQLQAVFSQWLPLSNAILTMIVDKLPSPLEMTEERAEKLLCSKARRFDSLPHQTQNLKKDFLACNSKMEAHTIVYVSKMFPVERKTLPENRQRPLTHEEIQIRREQARLRHAQKMAAQEEGTMCDTHASGIPIESDASSDSEQTQEDTVFIAFARVFSGTVRKGQRLYILGPKHDPQKALMQEEDISEMEHISCCEVQNLYMFMGRELESMDQVPAGNVLGLGGLEEYILKTATIADTPACPAFTDMHMEAAPIVRVAVEPIQAGDMKKLSEGLKLLNQADPCVEVLVQKTGEHVIIAAGEVHLQKCLDDLTQRFAKIEVNVSKAVVPFRETIVPPPKMDMVNEDIQEQNQNQPVKQPVKYDKDDPEILGEGLVEMLTANQKCVVRIHSVPLPNEVTLLLEDYSDLINTIDAYCHFKSSAEHNMTEEVFDKINAFKDKLSHAFGKDVFWRNAVEQIWCFGPNRTGANILLNKVECYDRTSIWGFLEQVRDTGSLRDYDNSIVSGFQLASLAGPLGEEPMMGVCFAVEKWEYLEERDCLNQKTRKKKDEGDGSGIVKKEVYGPFTGQLMSSVKESCRKAFQTQPQRLMAAMYTCNIQATADVLGKLYAVLGKRNGRVIYEDLKEGTSVFNITATLPVVESFGFAKEIRKRTSGLASPQLKFSHWEVIDVDPFWVPTTGEEYLHYGEKADSDNIARKYMNQIRKRKGLRVQEQIVEFAEKQRTLGKNK